MNFHDARVQISLVLLLVWALALLDNQGLPFLLFPFLCTLFTVVFDLLFTKLRDQSIHFPSSSIVTGLLVGLILSPFDNVVSVVVAPLLSVVSKHYIRLRGRQVFNPAAIALIGTSVILGSSVSWWAVASSRLTAGIIAIGATYILWRLHRVWQALIFLLSYGVYLVFYSGADSLLPLVFDGTVFLFAFIMLPEPMTTPAKAWWRFGWGVLVILIMIIYQHLFALSIDLLLLSLLTANAMWALWRIFGRQTCLST